MSQLAVYANSFLATLNTRLVLKGRGTDNAHETVPTFLMVDTTTIPPLPPPTSRDIFESAGKVRLFPYLSSAIAFAAGVLIYDRISLVGIVGGVLA